MPKGIIKVFRAETDVVGTLTRTQLNGPDDIPALKAIQTQYVITPLSRFTGQPAPSPAPAVAWPAWNASKAEGIGFIRYLNALLPFMPAVPSERAMRARFARIGIGPGLPFDPTRLGPKLRAALEEVVAEASQELKAKAQQQTSSQGFFGTSQQLGSDYLTFRSMGALLGIYGHSREEAFDATQQTGPDGKVLDGRRRWVMRLETGQLPPVTEFWLVTMYTLPDRLVVENPIQRYSMGDRTSGLTPGTDGSREIYVQSENP